MSIDLASFPSLNAYVVLAGAQITNSGSTTIVNGNLGSPGGSDPGGLIFTNGTVDDSANATVAQTQLTALVNAIAAIPTTAIIGTPTITTTKTFTPGKYTTTTNLVLESGGTIVLDAQNVCYAQFFLVANGNITFTAGSISLINGAQAKNVFFVSGAGISNALSGQSLFGVLIAQSGITLNTGSSVVGRLFAQTAAITLLNNSITLGPSAICPIPPLVPPLIKDLRILSLIYLFNSLFSGTNFGGNNFGGTNFGGTNFGGNNFGGTNFGGNNFGGNNFGGTNFGGNCPVTGQKCFCDK